MKKHLLKTLVLTISLMISSTSFSQSNFSSKIINVGVVVSDLEHVMDFYINGIG